MLSIISRFNLFEKTIKNKRSLWQWVDDTFNRFDEERTKEIGSNLACAEWLMKNGAQVRFKGCKEFVSHYDCLTTGQDRSIKQLKIEQVYAGKEATISHIGFNYFKDCENISDIAFVGCHTINNKALNKLQILKNCLTSLKISSCVNISDEGILDIEYLQLLNHLELKNIQFKNQIKVIDHLKSKLPQCNIIFSE